MTNVTITAGQGSLIVKTPYNKTWLEALYATVPVAMRRWDGANKAWLIDPSYGPAVAAMCHRIHGVKVALPQPVADAGETVRLFRVDYIANAKEGYCNGWVNGGWNMVLPEPVLRAWFGDMRKPDEDLSGSDYYQLLGVKRTVSEPDLKAMWKRLARQYHPDLNKEPDARTQFEAIKTAYDVLSDTRKRARYDAGLQLQVLATRHERMADRIATDFSAARSWRPALRCGHLMVKSVQRMGRAYVTTILDWQDILDYAGHVAVASWTPGDDSFTVKWVAP